VTLNVGAFLNTVINLVIVGFVLFLMVKSINSARRPAPEPAAPPTTEDVMLLREIRDALKK
jgi:large conductance mechanosensitive channel